MKSSRFYLPNIHASNFNFSGSHIQKTGNQLGNR